MARDVIGRGLCLVGMTIGLQAAACQAPDTANQAPASPPSSAVAMLFDPTGLKTPTDLYRIELSFPEQNDLSSIKRAGDLPDAGERLSVPRLPEASKAVVTMELFHEKFAAETKTHECRGEQPVSLVAGRTQSLNLDCRPVHAKKDREPVRVFLEMAQLELTLRKAPAESDNNPHPRETQQLFAGNDEQGRRISLRLGPSGATLNIGGALTFRTRKTSPAPSLSALARGEELTLVATGGRAFDGVTTNGVLSVEAPPHYESCGGKRQATFPVRFLTESGHVQVEGRLTEEDPLREFTIASYNVENLFDQRDSSRNSHYGDYRIEANKDGESSNYGDRVRFKGEWTTFTQVKIAGIKRALEAISMDGPAVVALQEIESERALEQLADALEPLGYTDARFTEWGGPIQPNAVGLGVLSKFPITEVELLKVEPPEDSDFRWPLRPVMKATLRVLGHPLVIYNNHWKSKSGPESLRKVAAEAIERDVEDGLETNPRLDYLVVGDLNSDYNEAVIIEDRHDDTNGITGINHVLKAQGDEMRVLRGEGFLKYNLHYELNRQARRTAYHGYYGWSSMDHIIVGSGVYDRRGITYVDNSFQAAKRKYPRLEFLFREDGTTKRWKQEELSKKYTRHKVGGYSDHTPIFARFYVPRNQSDETIPLEDPGQPDEGDPQP